MRKLLPNYLQYTKSSLNSLFKVLSFLVLSISINLIGYSIVYINEKMLFIDTIGTALASVAYGPIHGALVGVSANIIGSYLLSKNTHYVDFSVIHIWLAFIWGFIPRLIDGRACDFFDPDYSYKQIIGGVVVLGFLSSFATTLAATFIGYYSDIGLGCRPENAEFHFDFLICSLQQPLNEFIGKPALSWAIAEELINFPDKLLSFVCALLLIEKILPYRRLNLRGASGDFVSTNRPAVTIIITCLLVFAFCFCLNLVYKINQHHFEIAMLMLVSVTIITLTIIRTIVTNPSKWLLAPEKSVLLSSIYLNKNKNIENVFDDICKISILYYVLMYVSLSVLRPGFENGNRMMHDNLTSVVSIFVVVTIIQYFFIVIGRVFERELHF